MLISLGRISRHFFSPSRFDPLLCCSKVGLWRDRREIHTCLCLAIDILLTPFLFSTPPSPHLSFSLVHSFSDGPQWPIHPHALHWPGQEIQYPMDSNFSEATYKVPATSTRSLFYFVFPLLQPLESKQSPPSFHHLPLHCCEFIFNFFFFCMGHKGVLSSPLNTWRMLTFRQHRRLLSRTSSHDLHLDWIIAGALFSLQEGNNQCFCFKRRVICLILIDQVVFNQTK